MVDGGRNRGGWSKAALAYVERANEVLRELEPHWPVTLRQLYYQLVTAGDIDNSPQAYSKLSRMLTKGRLSGLVSWNAIEDRARAMLRPPRAWADRREFARQDAALFLVGYRRNLLQGQPEALEIWVEKDALSRLCQEAATPYQVPVIAARGFSSVSFLHDCLGRARSRYIGGQQTRVLYFGDLDPSGWEMLPAMLQTLQGEMDAGEFVIGERCALTLAQVESYGLPRNPDALKETDTRAAKYMEQFGDLAVGLDALRPDDLQALVEECIRARLDLSEWERQNEIEAAERQTLKSIRAGVQEALAKAVGGE